MNEYFGKNQYRKIMAAAIAKYIINLKSFLIFHVASNEHQAFFIYPVVGFFVLPNIAHSIAYKNKHDNVGKDQKSSH